MISSLISIWTMRKPRRRRRRTRRWRIAPRRDKISIGQAVTALLSDLVLEAA
jgi:hypothetical protein